MKERIKLKQGFGWRTVQLFSNYIFIDLVDQWRAVKSTRGILNLLTVCELDVNGDSIERPAVVKDDLIASIKAQENSDGLIVFNESRFKRGDAVQVKSGPFAFKLGTFDGLSSRDRVFVLLSVLGRLEVAEDNLIAI